MSARLQGATRVTPRVHRLPLTSVPGAVAVKTFGPGEQVSACAEALLLAHLEDGNGREYHVPELVRSVAGEPHVTIDESTVLITRWQDGIQKSFDAVTLDEWAALGRTLARLHDHLASAPVIGNASAPGFGLPDLAATIQTRDLTHERATIERHRAESKACQGPARIGAAHRARYFQERLLLFDERAERCRDRLPDVVSQVIHNDYNQFNYLFCSGGRITILDWERAIRAPREFEVVRCLNHLPLVAPTAAQTFVRAYLEVLPLSADILAWAVDASLTAHATKHWPVELWLAGEDGAEQRIADMGVMVSAFVAGRDRLDAFFVDVVGSRTQV